MISKVKVAIKATVSTDSVVVIMSPLLVAVMLQLAIVYRSVVDSAVHKDKDIWKSSIMKVDHHGAQSCKIHDRPACSLVPRPLRAQVYLN